ncbi:MAG: AmmeMemoRadiSam system radical SAM enzyme [Kiritimatiellia bacterium]|nr:AmmeMemoRadiSam system radical SAM enzyme [Kiritimatiellia bacterium]
MKDLSRRDFMCGCIAFGICAGSRLAAPAQIGRFAKINEANLKEAAFWEPLAGGRTKCKTCPNECESGKGAITRCNTRINRDGKLYSLTYGRPCVIYTDALEKNPLYHVAPGKSAIATATAGCNLTCTYCQNWDISQVGPSKTRNMDLSPAALVKQAVDRGLQWLTFSYTEPVAYLEYALAAAKIAHSQNIKVAIVTAAYINPKPLERLIESADAFSVTLKGYSEEFYRDVCGARLDKTWEAIRTIARTKKWLEIVTLIVPGLNDRPEGLRYLAKAQAKLNRNIPLHYLRFSPAYKLKHLSATPVKTLENARENALKEGLKYVYLSNLPGHAAANTYCPACSKILVERIGFKIIRNNIQTNRCSFCRQTVPGLWS